MGLKQIATGPAANVLGDSMVLCIRRRKSLLFLTLSLVLIATPSVAEMCERPTFRELRGWHPISNKDLLRALDEAKTDEESKAETMKLRELTFYDALRYPEAYKEFNIRIHFFGEPGEIYPLFDMAMDVVNSRMSTPSKSKGKLGKEAEFVMLNGAEGARLFFDYRFESEELTADVRNEIWLLPNFHCECAYMIDAQYPKTIKPSEYKDILRFIKSVKLPDCRG